MNVLSVALLCDVAAGELLLDCQRREVSL